MATHFSFTDDTKTRIKTGVDGTRVVRIIVPLKGMFIEDTMKHTAGYDNQLRDYFGLPAIPEVKMY